jgi:hypothetical protein
VINRRLKTRIDQLERAIVPAQPRRVFFMPQHNPTPAQVPAFEAANGVWPKDVLVLISYEGETP